MPYKTFGFTDEQVLMRDNVLALLARVLPPEKVRALDERSEFPQEAFEALAEAGWLALPFPEELGGVNASNKDMAVFIEAMGYHDYGARSAYMTTVVYGGGHLQHHATPELRDELLPRLIRGEVKMAISYSEPESGSDAAGIRTRAVRDGDDYVINGQKIYSTNAHVADYLVASVKTDPDAGRHGLSLFVVDTKLPGVEIRPMDALGARTSRPNEVFLDDIRVPSRYLLGEENQGWRALMRGLNQERLLLAATSAGHCLKIIEIAKAFAGSRVTFGKKITEYQAISHKFADMQMLTEQARLVTFHAAEMLDAGEDAVLETSIAKVVATENNYRVADMGVQIMGGAGYVAGDMQRLFREARVGPIGGGSSEIMRNVIAKRMEL
ncbi:MAG: acyl-CoA dehydrogenase family protein [Alphaproteobacteria bacterium]|nr:acyl-CoA dehydrogenase family protein [Alphaproteobacteria bacterium]